MIIGLEIPLITRINEQFIIKLKLNLAAVLKMDYVGSLAGALVWIFLLPIFFEQIQAAFVLGALNILVAAFTLVFFKKMLKLKLLLIISILIAATSVFIGYINAKDWRVFSEQYLYRDLVVFSETTEYQHIVITQSRSNDISCYINGHLQFNSIDEYIYHENLVHPAFNVTPYHKNILVLGGGDGLALREILKYSNVKKVVLCDIDPAMTSLAKDNQYISDINENSLKDSRVVTLQNNALIPADSTSIYISNKNIFHNRGEDNIATVEIINLDATTFFELF